MVALEPSLLHITSQAEPPCHKRWLGAGWRTAFMEEEERIVRNLDLPPELGSAPALAVEPPEQDPC